MRFEVCGLDLPDVNVMTATWSLPMLTPAGGSDDCSEKSLPSFTCRGTNELVMEIEEREVRAFCKPATQMEWQHMADDANQNGRHNQDKCNET